eukprot:gene9726-13091_t
MIYISKKARSTLRIIPPSYRGLSFVTITSQQFKSHNKDFLVKNGDLKSSIIQMAANNFGSPFPKELFIDSVKDKVIDHVSSSIKDMLQGEAVGESASKLIFGEKGIGKTNALIASVIAASIIHSNLKTVYAEYVGSDIKPISSVLGAALDISGLPDGDNKYSIQSCISHLETTNQYALIVVDEVDQIYTANKKALNRKILDELAELGCQKSGRVYTIICGSSSVTPQLINKNGVKDSDIFVAFPQLADAPNLNSSKYSTLYTYRGERDYELAMKNYGVDNKQTQSLIYFHCGANLRLVSRLVKSYRKGRILEIERECIPKWDSIADNNSAILINKLYNKIVCNNVEMIDACLHCKEKIVNYDWVTHLIPLTSCEVKECIDAARQDFSTSFVKGQKAKTSFFLNPSQFPIVHIFTSELRPNETFHKELSNKSNPSCDILSINRMRHFSNILSWVTIAIICNIATSTNTNPSAIPTAFPSCSHQPSFKPSFKPSTPTAAPTAKPSKPTARPTTRSPTFSVKPTLVPSQKPSGPTANPTTKPTKQPVTSQPTFKVTPTYIGPPTAEPTSDPTFVPTTLPPSAAPTQDPTEAPSSAPSGNPTEIPSAAPTSEPTTEPTSEPSTEPTSEPSSSPTAAPSGGPTPSPTSSPSPPQAAQTRSPTFSPTVLLPPLNTLPTALPTCSLNPTRQPTKTLQPGVPSNPPTRFPTCTPEPSSKPTVARTTVPTKPTAEPTAKPTKSPNVPTAKPSNPTVNPTKPIPTAKPTTRPSKTPTTGRPSQSPTPKPTLEPTPTYVATGAPTPTYGGLAVEAWVLDATNGRSCDDVCGSVGGVCVTEGLLEIFEEGVFSAKLQGAKSSDSCTNLSGSVTCSAYNQYVATTQGSLPYISSSSPYQCTYGNAIAVGGATCSSAQANSKRLCPCYTYGACA